VSYQQTFKNIDDILRKDAGASSELDYTEQTSWILFLKYLDDLEKRKAVEAELKGATYTPIIAPEFKWESWAAPKDADGKFDHKTAMSGKDLLEFVDLKLFPYLSTFTERASGPDTIEYKIGEIYSNIKNKLQSGYTLRDVLELVDELDFGANVNQHELSSLYEVKIKNMGNAGRNGGEYYTPRPLIRAMIQVIDPQIGETIYDPAVGSAGFLCEAFDYMRAKPNLSTSDLETLQRSTFYGKEKKSLAYVIGIMNMVLHGIEAPNIIHKNTLTEEVVNIQAKDRRDIILANPPFGGKERAEVQENFPIKTGETAFLFLQHFIKSLKAGGRAAIVIKNTFLSNDENAAVALRKELLEACNLYAVLDLPGGTFQGAGVKTVVLFFRKGEPTRKTWFYALDPGRTMGKKTPLNDKDLSEFVQLSKSAKQGKGLETAKSWNVKISDLDMITADLTVKNPNTPKAAPLREPQEILAEIAILDAENANLIDEIRGLL